MNYVGTFKETFKEAIQTYDLERDHVADHHAPQYVCFSIVPLWPTSEQALVSQHELLDIFYQINESIVGTIAFSVLTAPGLWE